ncbi:TetR/AcrR family transcriptional regulator [Kitasatospora purpeofusca]|uniref:TetR/AcrR family transcriptional regulator n=1 Tax=Kitasatospora purpeofusca TaxID=67352 RepID=UPI000691BF36|nr:TetR/AcrR family transcriptional regulator [Kitasatospora purpeofusca]
MTARVDHEERRRQIAEALLRIADTQGLQSASMRAVAAEAGVSLRLVQYYFETKQGLLLDALTRLAAQLQARMEKWIGEAGSPPTPRGTVTAILSCILPTDPESRRIARTYAAYYTLVLNDPEVLEKHGARQPELLEGFLAKRIAAAQEAGEVDPGKDPGIAAAGLLAMVNGLGSSVLGGQRTGEAATAILARHLDELFRTPGETARALPSVDSPNATSS